VAHRIASRALLPEGPRFASLDVYIDPDGGDPLAWAFGALGVQDKARHLATPLSNDLADVLREPPTALRVRRYAESWPWPSHLRARWPPPWPQRHAGGQPAAPH
jgi:hypothetical protein